ncbi:hypothetical protein ACLOJK_007850 [Asimina triloba]
MVNLRQLKIDNTWKLDCLPRGLGRISRLQTLRKFIVGGEGGCGIDELQRLNSLRGEIEIKQLERAPSGEEARKSELWNKSDLHTLVLNFERDEAIMMSEKDAEIDRMDSVLEGLRPHANLDELKLDCNRRISKLPSWLEDASLSKLTKLEIRRFVHDSEQNNNMSGLGKLPLLKYLNIEHVGVREVGYEFYYGKNSSNDSIEGRRRGVAFPKLEQLSFHDMLELEEWELEVEADAEEVMPSLRYLKLEHCPNLKKLPHGLSKTLTELIISNCRRIEGTTEGSGFPLLEEFTLVDSSGFFSSGLPDLPNLKEFKISRLRNEMLPEEGWERLVVLQKLRLDDCDESKSLPNGLAKLRSLTNLGVGSCRKLESLFEGLGQLKKLESLSIRGSEVLTCLPDSLGKLESLEYLNIMDLKKLQSLPDSLALVQSLEHLRLSGLLNLEFLPQGLGQLKKLKFLEICDAQMLTSFLADSLGQLELLQSLCLYGVRRLESLPEGLGQLKKLTSLAIWDAEALTRLPNSLGQLESLQNLDLRRMERLELLPEGLGQLKKFRWLKIFGAETLTQLHDSVTLLESLESFEIMDSKKLESLPHSLGQFKKLESLRIRNMEALASLPDSLGQIESLRELKISYCPKLKSLPPRGFPVQLERLTLENLEALTCPSDVLGRLESLEDLTLINLKEFESLSPWLGQLKALRRLNIFNCTTLRCSKLPHELRRLPLLQVLRIRNCPILLERCKREGGQGWYKNISHVPRIHIDNETIR